MMPSKSTSLLFLSVSFALIFTSAYAASYKVVNLCFNVVWAASTPMAGGKMLKSGEEWTFDVPPNSNTHSVSIWGRTQCHGNYANGSTFCETGDCNGRFKCTDAGKPPLTLAKFTKEHFSGDQRYFELSLTHGFNIAMKISASKKCDKFSEASCRLDNHQCPKVDKVPGGCNPCPKSGCRGSEFFRSVCPQASVGPDQVSRQMAACPPQTSYTIYFCPST